MPDVFANYSILMRVTLSRIQVVSACAEGLKSEHALQRVRERIERALSARDDSSIYIYIYMCVAGLHTAEISVYCLGFDTDECLDLPEGYH